MEIAATTVRKKGLEEKRQIEIGSGLKTGQEPQGTRWYRAKTMVISLPLDQELTKIQQVRKKARNSKKFVAAKTKEHVPHRNGGGQWRSPKEQRSHKIDAALNERTREIQVLGGFHVITAETVGLKVVAKRRKSFSRIQDTMGNFPI